MTWDENYKPECECNDCAWQGEKDDLVCFSDGYYSEILECPECGSEDIYYF